jgi:hypothetical protein
MSARRCNPELQRRLDPSTVLAPNAPAFLKDVDRRLERLYTHPGRFAELVGRNLVGRHEKLRARREDRRANWVKVARSYGRQLDRRTWRNGRPRGDRRDSADTPSVDDTAAACGVSAITVKRINAELEAAGLIDSHRVVMEYVDGNGFCGLPSVRCFTRKFLRLLGFSDKKIDRAQAQGAAVWRAQTGRAISPAAVKQTRKAINTVGRAYQATPTSPPIILEPDADLRLERLRLLEEHPDWGLERAAVEARRLLRP